MLAPDGFLTMGSEGLDAKAGPCDTSFCYRLRPFARHGARVDFNRPLGLVQPEMAVERIDKLDKFRGQDRVGAAPAKGDTAHTSIARQQLCHRLDLRVQRIQIAFDPLAPPARRSVAAAIKTDFFAERDVDVERYIARGLFNPFFQCARRQLSKVGSRGIAGVARYRRFEQVGIIGPHVSRSLQKDWVRHRPQGRSMSVCRSLLMKRELSCVFALDQFGLLVFSRQVPA